MKQKTHSGAKKRLRVTGNGRVKRRKANLRHLLAHKSSERKRHLGEVVQLHVASAYQVERLLVMKRPKTHKVIRTPKKPTAAAAKAE